MIIRNARREDAKVIEELYNKYDFKLDLDHTERLLVAQEKQSIVAVMGINTVLECCFLTSDGVSRKNKINSLKRLVTCGILEIKELNYDGIHAFANESIAPILKKHFGFVPGIGENLFLFVE